MEGKITITSVTTDPSGKTRRWTRLLAPMRRTPTSGWGMEPTTEADAIRYIEKYMPPLFYGCKVTVQWHAGPPFTGVVDPDTRVFKMDEVTA